MTVTTKVATWIPSRLTATMPNPPNNRHHKPWVCGTSGRVAYLVASSITGRVVSTKVVLASVSLHSQRFQSHVSCKLSYTVQSLSRSCMNVTRTVNEDRQFGNQPMKVLIPMLKLYETCRWLRNNINIQTEVASSSDFGKSKSEFAWAWDHDGLLVRGHVTG